VFETRYYNIVIIIVKQKINNEIYYFASLNKSWHLDVTQTSILMTTILWFASEEGPKFSSPLRISLAAENQGATQLSWLRGTQSCARKNLVFLNGYTQ
jgi:hypothetical protein